MQIIKRVLKIVIQCLNSVIFISKSIIYLDAYIISSENYNVIEQFVFNQRMNKETRFSLKMMFAIILRFSENILNKYK